MEVTDQIKRFQEFLETDYKAELLEKIRKNETFIVLDFFGLSKFDPDLAGLLLDQPEETIKAAELAVENIEEAKKFHVRFDNLPESQKIMIKDIRSKHIGKFLVIKGVVRQKSDVRPQVTAARFECPSCGNIISVLQLDTAFKEPSRCGCGRKGKFHLLTKELVDAQGLVLEESPEDLEGGEQPKRMSVFLKDDLVSPMSEKKTNPGSKVSVVGIVKEIPIVLRTGGTSTRFDLLVDANNVEAAEESFLDIEITSEEEKEIKEIAQDPNVYTRLINSIAPSIYGYERVKEALLLQLMSGVQKKRQDGIISRGDMHVLLIGDPGAGKSQLLKRINFVAPKSRYVSGKGISAAGLTASVVKDEFLRGWSLEAGAMVLSSNGICCLHPDTNVINNNQIIRIKDIFDENKIKVGKVKNEIIELNDVNGFVPSINTKNLTIKEASLAKIRRKYYKGRLLNIDFESGFSIKLTPDHKIIDGNSLEWKEAKDFSANDCVISPLRLSSNNKDVYLLDMMPDGWKVGLDKWQKNELEKRIKKRFKTLPEFNEQFNLNGNCFSRNNQFSIKKFKEIINFLDEYEKWRQMLLKYTRNKNGEKLKIAKLTPELGYILGFVFGDGHVKITSRRTSIRVTQSLVHKEYINKFISCWKKIFDKAPNQDIRTRKSFGKYKSTCLMLYHGSNLLGNIYNKYVGNSLSSILQLPDNVLKSFIAGAMDSDGCISTKTCKKNGKYYKIQHIDFLLSNDIKTNLNFILALRRLDCYGKLVNINKNPKSVRITGRKDIKTFKDAIGGYSVKICKTTILERSIKISSISDKLPSQPIAKLCEKISQLNKSLLLKMGVWSNIYEFKKMKRQPSRDQLYKIADRLNRYLNANTLSAINLFLSRDFFLDRVIGIKEEDYSGYVYDLFIPENHNFVANGIIVHNCIDEIDKMSAEDTGAMHEALEQQTVSISKANIQATLIAKTTVLAAANPKFGRFDPYGVVADQINLPSTLINRFDLIFPIKDIPDETRDRAMATHILNLHQKPETIEPEIPTKLLKKYIAYTKQKITPKLTDSALDEIKDYYIKMRMAGAAEEGIKTIPISPRQLEALVRLSEASAKIRLSDKVTKKDAKRAIDILQYCLMQVGLDKETGKIDIDRIATGVPASTRNHILVVKEIIAELENKIGKTIPIDDIVAEAKEKGIDDVKVEEVIERLKRSGDIFEPRHGFLQKI